MTTFHHQNINSSFSSSQISSSSSSSFFSPPIFCLKLLFERISSPWEYNFEQIKFINVRFLPSSSSTFSNINCSNYSSFNSHQIRVGSGHLFFIRGNNKNNKGEGPAVGFFLDFEAKSGDNEQQKNNNNQKIWKGRFQLINENNEKIHQFACPLQQQQNNLNNDSLILQAHFLASIVEIQQRKTENLISINKGIEKQAQTDNNTNINLVERGIQTNKELTFEKIFETKQQNDDPIKTTTTILQNNNNKQRQKDKKLIKLLLILLLKAKNDQKIQKQHSSSSITKSTITECSLPPYSDHLFNKLTKNNKIQIGHFRSQIGYLSSVHRTFVQDKKINYQQKREENNKNIKKKLKTIREEEQKIKLDYSSPISSSGLQSIATSPKEIEQNNNTMRELNLKTKFSRNKNEKFVPFNNIEITRRNADYFEQILTKKTTFLNKENQNSSSRRSSSSTINRQNTKDEKNNKTSTTTKSSSSSSTTNNSSKSDENSSVNSNTKDKRSVISSTSQLSSVKNSTSTTKSSSTNKTKKSSESTKNKKIISNSDSDESTDKKSNKSSKTSSKSATTEKSRSSISGGEN